MLMPSHVLTPMARVPGLVRVIDPPKPVLLSTFTYAWVAVRLPPIQSLQVSNVALLLTVTLPMTVEPTRLHSPHDGTMMLATVVPEIVPSHVTADGDACPDVAGKIKSPATVAT